MDRRDFLKAGSTLIATASIYPELHAEAAASIDSGRLTLPMNRGWLYSPHATAAARERDFQEAGFETVVIPHTNIKLPWHSFDDKDYEFTSIYRRHFKLPAEAKGNRVFVDFEGVMTASTVWLNGMKLGEYKGGYPAPRLRGRQRAGGRGRLFGARRHSPLRISDRLHDLRRDLPRGFAADCAVVVY
jgi:beta-galactosidase